MSIHLWAEELGGAAKRIVANRIRAGKNSEPVSEGNEQ